MSESEKLSVMLLLSGFARNEATLTADLGAASTTAPTGQEIMTAWGRRLARLTDPERFPALHAALASGVFDHDDDPDDEFAFGLERVLDGIHALVSR